MTFMLRRPILVGGLGLTLGLSVLETLHPSNMNFGGSLVWGSIALGSGVWWLKQQTQKPLDLSPVLKPVDRTAVEKAFAAIEVLLTQFNSEIETTSVATQSAVTALDQFREQLAHLQAELDRKEIRLAIVGGKAAGKTALRQQLVSGGLPQGSAELPTQFSIQDTPGLYSSEAERIQTLVAPVAHGADLILFVTTGDLTCSELENLQTWVNQQQRVMLVFNKQDQYLPADRPLVLQQLRQRVQAYLSAEDVVAIAAAPAVVKVRQHQADGSIQERLEQPPSDVSALTERLGQVLTQAGQPLVLATVMRQAIALRSEIIAAFNQVRRDRAMPLIEQSQWIAAAAAFANPVPSLDLLATAAINAQLVVDLGAIYRQKISLEQAKTVASTLASQMVKLGLVELSTQAIAPLLKSNALTYVAGGLMQGISAAYLTRIAGLSLVAYFEEQSLDASTESTWQVDRLIQKLKAVFQDNQRTAFLQSLVKQGISRLVPTSSFAPSLPNPTA
jgi:uncharacterized protein